MVRDGRGYGRPTPVHRPEKMTHGPEPRAAADRRPPRRGRDGRRPGDRHPGRSDPDPGRDRHHGDARARGDGARPRPHRALGAVRRPQPPAGRLPQRRRPPVPPQRVPAVRALVQQAGQRRQPPGAHAALRHPGQDAARVGQPHVRGGLPRHARDRRRRARGRDGDGRRAVPPADAADLGDRAGGASCRTGSAPRTSSSRCSGATTSPAGSAASSSTTARGSRSSRPWTAT